MPYHTVKVKGGYYVEDINGRRYSKKPLSKSKAEKQMIALRINHPDDEGGSFANAFKFATDAISNIGSKIKSGIQRITTVRNDYPPAERDLIAKYGNSKIKQICLYREPLASAVNTMSNILSLGQFNKVKNKYGIDEFYHLMMVVTVDYNQQMVPILLEKNEVINIHEFPNMNPSAQKLELQITPQFNYTFKEFLDNGQKAMGDRYFKYDALTNNCQDYLSSIVSANPPLQKDNPNAMRFILQDKSGLQRDINPRSKNLFSGITGLAARFNHLAKGSGFLKTKDTEYSE